ncbi:hypothetical protein BBP40_012395 [Aspergillus hancockii]|nr:hypothetical protein BBP40_012395 [Aspergillus hancockii]
MSTDLKTNIGNFCAGIPWQGQAPLEERATTLEGQDKVAFLGLIRKMLRWEPGSILVTCLAFCTACIAIQADIRADSNRDGAVGLIGDTNLNVKHSWSKYSRPEAWGTVGVQKEISREECPDFPKGGNRVGDDNDHKFSKKELEKGLELGIDARDTCRPLGWDGQVKVQFHVQNGRRHSDDSVCLRVAPVLTHHPLQPDEEFISSAGNESITPHQHQFVTNMKAAIKKTGVNKPLFLFSHSDDVWVQDIVEPGYTSMPGPDGLITLRVMIRSTQPSRIAGRQVFEYLRKTGRGAVYGFVDPILPGRIIGGAHGTLEPHIYDYMRAQEVQDPLILDADWLAVGHVDGFIQFLPAKDSLHGWVFFIADPVDGIDILKKAVRDGHGDVPAFSRKNASHHLPDVPDPYVPGYTTNELLAQPDFVKKNAMFTERIERGDIAGT